MARDDDAVDIAGVLLIREEGGEHIDQLIEDRAAVGLDIRGAHIEEHALTEDDVPVVPDADLVGTAHDRTDLLAHLLQDGEAEHCHFREGFHLRLQFADLAVGGVEVIPLLTDEFLLRSNGLGLFLDLHRVAGDLLLLEIQRELRGVQRSGDVLQLCLGVLYLGHGPCQQRLCLAQLQLRAAEELLRVLQVVARDQVLDVREEHQKKEDQGHGGHHVRITRPEALLASRFTGERGSFACTDPSHSPACLSESREARRSMPVRSRTLTSRRSTVPRRL